MHLKVSRAVATLFTSTRWASGALGPALCPEPLPLGPHGQSASPAPHRGGGGVSNAVSAGAAAACAPVSRVTPWSPVSR